MCVASDLLAAASGNAIKIKLITKFKGNFNVIFFFMACNFPKINHKYGRNKINDRNLYMLYTYVCIYILYIYVYMISSELCLRNLPQTFCEFFSFLFDFSLVIVVVVLALVVVVVTLSADDVVVVVVVVVTAQLVVAS